MNPDSDKKPNKNILSILGIPGIMIQTKEKPIDSGRSIGFLCL